MTWFHDTRTPSPLDATKGWYTSVQEFLASSKFGSQTDFNRVDVTNSTYYSFGKTNRSICLRGIRGSGLRRTSGRTRTVSADPKSSCFGTSADDECELQRGAAAGAVVCGRRDVASRLSDQRGGAARSADGLPGGRYGGVCQHAGAAAAGRRCCRWWADSVNFVVFHDMGNVFQHLADMFPSYWPVPPAGLGDVQGCVDGSDRDVQLQLLLACGRAGCAVQDAGRADPCRLQLQPESADLSGDLTTSTTACRMWGRRATSTSSSALDRASR